jgi:adenylate kinase
MNYGRGRDVISVLGLPAAGKTTIANELARDFSLPVVAIGALMRMEMAARSPMGVMLNGYDISATSLYPDEVSFALLAKRISMSDCIRGFVLDGFPRTPGQAELLFRCFLKPADSLVTLIVDVDSDIAWRRHSAGRSTCAGCGKAAPATHLTVCECGGALGRPSDDEWSKWQARRESHMASLPSLVHALEGRAPVVTLRNNDEGIVSASSLVRAAFEAQDPLASQINTVISGTHARHSAAMDSLSKRLARSGVRVLTANGALSADAIDSRFAKIRESSFLTLANFDGELDAAMLADIGFAIASGLEILSVYPITDPNIAPYSRSLSTVVPGIEAEVVVGCGT